MINSSCRLMALCRSNSAILSQKVAVIDSLLNRTHADAAKKIYRAVCPVVGGSMGQHYRHSIDHMERCSLDGLHILRDGDKPIDLHYDIRERETLTETDPFEARDRILFVQDVMDGVCASCEREGSIQCSIDAEKTLTAYFMLLDEGDTECPLASTLERELAFVGHHAIHHMAMVRAMAAAGYTGLSLEDLPPDFGRAPGSLVLDRKENKPASA